VTDDVPALTYGTNVGCVARVSHGGSPTQCGAEEAAAVPHTYLYPRRHTTRLYVCAVHGELHPAAEPLTNRDRAIIRGRRVDRDRLLRAAGRSALDS
jgi:hypothetical protein